MISVKRNQPRLFQQLQAACAVNQPSGRFIDVEKTRSRVTCRIVSMFDEISSIDPDWQGLKSFVQVDRIGTGIIHSRSENNLSILWERNRSALVRES